MSLASFSMPIAIPDSWCWALSSAKFRISTRHMNCASSYQEGKVPKLDKILEEDSEDEETPDQEIQIPEHKVKLVVGPGGEKIKFIQRKSKCRLQVTWKAFSLFGKYSLFMLSVSLNTAFALKSLSSAGHNGFTLVLMQYMLIPFSCTCHTTG